jgi:oxygen-independent coproporphyrinogen-3 oxidase
MPKPALLYIHIPFCIHHCQNCTACVLVGDSESKRSYLDALEAEVIAAAPALSEYSFSAVYVGGGSPTTLNPDALAKLMGTIRRVLPVQTRAEITTEVMPQTVCTASLGGLKAGSTNRISLSMQSAIQAELETLDCGFTTNDVQNAILFLDRFHFNKVNLDLMYGIPGQTLHSLENTLRVARNYLPVHLSLYPFFENFSPNIPDTEGVEKNVQTYDPKEELLDFAVKRLSEYGYERYSKFHFAKNGGACAYWKARYAGTEYVGLGLGARSLVDGFTYTNTTDWETYRDHSAEFEHIAIDVAELSPQEMKQYVSASTKLLEAYS